MPRGIIETLGLAGTVLFAAPVALLGAEFLFGGNVLQGALFLAIAVGMVLLPRVVTTPDDVAASAAEKTVEKVVKVEDEDS